MSDIKCMQCGLKLSGPALYCYGCYSYFCRGCGVASGFNEFDCPRDAVEMDKIYI